MSEPWVQIAGAVLVLVGALFTARAAARATVTASAQATSVEARRVDLEEWQGLLDEVKKERAEDRTRIDRLEVKLRSLEGELREASRLLKSALVYIERLLDFISDHMPGAPGVPQIPAALHEHLPPDVLDNWRIPPPPPEQP